jgi:signal transduction histidine kinase
MRRASELITSFKRVAVDRTSERRQKFALRKAIEQLLMALRPTLKQSPWNIHVEGPDDLVLDSYPGPLEQVISNLLINAFMHAFEGREQGTVSIILKAVKKTSPETGVWVRIDVLDDGVGMGATVAQRIFEPFFTTKMGRGGSGLGLSISHSIVTGLLGGTLNVETAPGQGTRFVLELPTIAPMTAPISESATTSP